MTPSSQSPTPQTDDVLASLLKKDAVPMATLHERYGPVLELVRILIGVVPNCDTYLEIWPPAFRTYNIMVPNFLNLPASVFGLGGAPKVRIVGISDRRGRLLGQAQRHGSVATKRRHENQNNCRSSR